MDPGRTMSRRWGRWWVRTSDHGMRGCFCRARPGRWGRNGCDGVDRQRYDRHDRWESDALASAARVVPRIDRSDQRLHGLSDSCRSCGSAEADTKLHHSECDLLPALANPGADGGLFEGCDLWVISADADRSLPPGTDHRRQFSLYARAIS